MEACEKGHLLLALAGAGHLGEEPLEGRVLVQLVLLHQPAQVARRRRQLNLKSIFLFQSCRQEN